MRRRIGLVLVECVLLGAIPVLGYLGAQTLLDSRSGTFVGDPAPGEPGFRALVDPSPVSAVVEVLDGQVAGLTLLTSPGRGEPGGGVVVVPGELVYEDRPLSERRPEEAVAALADLLALGIGETVVVDDAAWSAALAGGQVSIDNPDPVADAGGVLAFAVGPVTLTGEEIAAYLAGGRPDSGEEEVALTASSDASARLFRRRLVWEALLAAPPGGETALAQQIEDLAGGPHAVELLPTEAVGEVSLLDAEAAEALVRRLVPFPAGAAPGDRLKVRVLGEAAADDVYAAAAEVARLGFEVVEVGHVARSGSGGDGSDNAGNGGGNEVIVSTGFADDRLVELIAAFDAGTVETPEVDAGIGGAVTLLLG